MKYEEPGRPREGAKLFKVGGNWGDAIGWSNFPTRVHGWKTPMPEEGDILTCEMQSGKTGVWIFGKVEPCRDPEDMFFAKVAGVDYTDNVSFPLPTT